MGKRATPGITSGSMADVSFILLFFFLMVSSMDSDYGLQRLLPPPVDDTHKNDDTKVNERNVFVVLINQQDQLQVEGQLMDIRNLRERTKEFFLNPTNNPDFSDKKEEEIPLFGKVMISRGVVSLQNDRGTSYKTYMMVQNELTAAINEMKDDLARSRFAKAYDDLTEEELDAVSKYIPMSISEAEPRNIGGK